MVTERKKIFFRADGSSTMGLGHIIRSLALADMMKATFHTAFATTNDSAFIKEQITGTCNEYHLVKSEDDFRMLLKGDEIAVLDGYHFDSEYQRSIKSRVHKLVTIDDQAEIHFVADLVINPAGELIREKYSMEDYTKLAIGLRYALLREDFLSAAKTPRIVSKVDTLFICMGGADPFNITVKALEACIAIPFIKKIFVVSGSAYSNKAKLLASVERARHFKDVIHEENIDARRMTQLIGESEIAICPSSSIAIETCCVKSGLLTGTFVNNQQYTHRLLIDAGCCISIGDFNAAKIEDIQGQLELLADVRIVNEMIRRQSETIDGLSGDRLLNEFKLLAEC